jgi:hypothetical protein
LVLDFSEIPPAKGGSADSDTFEQFAAELLKLIGYEEVRGPSRGADGGKDLIVEEVRKGISRNTKIRWLVSCKHFVHGGKAVGVSDESDISDRVNQHKCAGFLGVYSTLPSASLDERLQQQPFEFQLLTPEQIEKYLLDSPQGIKLAERFFPESMKRWSRENPRPAELFSEKIDIRCEQCRRNLLEEDAKGIYVILYRYDGDEKKITGVHFVCKGDCDRQLTPRVRKPGEVDGWDDIDDLKIPVVFLRKVFGIMNSLRSGEVWDDEAFRKFRRFLTEMARYTMRFLTESEKEKIRHLKVLWDTGLF